MLCFVVVFFYYFYFLGPILRKCWMRKDDKGPAFVGISG